jgi:hypothetical protein
MSIYPIPNSSFKEHPLVTKIRTQGSKALKLTRNTVGKLHFEAVAKNTIQGKRKQQVEINPHTYELLPYSETAVEELISELKAKGEHVSDEVYELFRNYIGAWDGYGYFMKLQEKYGSIEHAALNAIRKAIDPLWNLAGRGDRNEIKERLKFPEAKNSKAPNKFRYIQTQLRCLSGKNLSLEHKTRISTFVYKLHKQGELTERQLNKLQKEFMEMFQLTSRKRTKYIPPFKEAVIGLLNKGVAKEEIAQRLGINAQTLNSWISSSTDKQTTK